MNFTYLYQPPKKYTFEQPKLKRYVESWCKGHTCNLFAGFTKLRGINEFRVDMDPTTNPDYCGDALDFLKSTDMKFDTIILDPPYNTRKSREKYNGRWVGDYKRIKDAVPSVMKDNSIAISLGYDTVGLSRSRGFEKIAICVICHLGDHNDTLLVVERKANKNILEAVMQ